MSEVDRRAPTAPCSGPARSPQARARALAALVALAIAVTAPEAVSFAAPPGATPPGATRLAPAPVPMPAADLDARWQVYHATKKSEGVAVAIEFFLPGFGSLYANHWEGTLTTWGLSAAGFLAFVWGTSQMEFGDPRNDSSLVPLAAWGGFALMAGARIHGMVDAFRSTGRYNREVMRGLGLHRGVIVAPMPLHVNGQTTLGMGASWQF